MSEASKVLDPLVAADIEVSWVVIDRANESAVMAGPFETSIEAITARERWFDWAERDYWVVPGEVLQDVE